MAAARILVVLGVAGKMGPTLARMARRAIDAGASMQEVYAAAVRETSQTYVQEAETA